MMRARLFLRVTLVLLLGCAARAQTGPMWELHFEADKGEMTVRSPAEAITLERLLRAGPASSPDPLMPGERIVHAHLQRLGMIASQPVVEVRLRVEGGYYSHFFMLVLEVAPGRYRPIYVQQYAEGVRQPSVTAWSFGADRAKVRVQVDYTGRLQSRTIDDVTLYSGRGSEVQVVTVRR